jgi:hypothetical protein
MKETDVIIDLDHDSLNCIQALAEKTGRTVSAEVAHLLEKGVSITETQEKDGSGE